MDGSTILKLVLKLKYEDVDRFRLTRDRKKWGGFCQHGNEPSGFVKFGEFLE